MKKDFDDNETEYFLVFNKLTKRWEFRGDTGK